MLRAVIFDFNGIIVDDEPVHFELFQRVLREQGISLTREDYYGRYLGFDDRGAFSAAYREHQRALDDRELTRLIDLKARYYKEMIQTKLRVFPGVKALAAELSKEFPLAIASGALKGEIEMLLAAIGLRDYFRVIVSAEDVTAGKPDPEIFLKALAELNARVGCTRPIIPNECIVIEDSREGIHGACRAGMPCLAVTNSHPRDQLKEASAIVKSLEEVTLSFLRNL
ncbi:MAG TPA: HAD family phosphatase, partial [Terriglobales bacterium]|nr:HAD family phosphatase [Terriglobales bacterium]